MASNNRLTKADLEAIGGLIDAKLSQALQPIYEKLDEHSKILKEHTKILHKHSLLLEKHSNIFIRNNLK
ncbi:MAG: hypothetical protein ACRCRZ_01150 [Metamycoplasmataceae bacterium]